MVIALPLLHPEALPFHMDAPKVLMPVIPKPPVPVVQAEAGSFGALRRVLRHRLRLGRSYLHTRQERQLQRTMDLCSLPLALEWEGLQECLMGLVLAGMGRLCLL